MGREKDWDRQGGEKTCPPRNEYGRHPCSCARREASRARIDRWCRRRLSAHPRPAGCRELEPAPRVLPGNVLAGEELLGDCSPGPPRPRAGLGTAAPAGCRPRRAARGVGQPRWIRRAAGRAGGRRRGTRRGSRGAVSQLLRGEPASFPGKLAAAPRGVVPRRQGAGPAVAASRDVAGGPGPRDGPAGPVSRRSKNPLPAASQPEPLGTPSGTECLLATYYASVWGEGRPQEESISPAHSNERPAPNATQRRSTSTQPRGLVPLFPPKPNLAAPKCIGVAEGSTLPQLDGLPHRYPGYPESPPWSQPPKGILEHSCPSALIRRPCDLGIPWPDVGPHQAPGTALHLLCQHPSSSG
ncbi:nascent polypeptide-associated complex subunit alpha, muscle-specific form-like [Sagmatias obliquidens]|uniref:nascent polypeptide-associated complex subunit alpha, muscle-specific form-like n=1 Tax=Sagmatias obliquidens TaxID=3371155 RepID=UPI000F440BD5|nr:nascent polypeptide-associated complex subunit alpha, muscle-specific form-like [Lagenorhynchus obliquidens]